MKKVSETNGGNNANTMSPVVPFGFQVVINDMACISKEWKQHKFPKSKKIRIRKKWSKRSVNFRVQDVHRAIKMQDKLFVSSLIFEKLKGLPQA